MYKYNKYSPKFAGDKIKKMLIKTTHINGIGLIEYKKSAKAKHLRICVQKGKSISVSVPQKMPIEKAEDFVNSKLKWIEKSVLKINTTKQEHTIFNSENEFKTKFRTLKLLPDNRTNLRLKISDKTFEIYYPETSILESEDIQETIRKMVEHVWKVEAHEYLPNRIKELAETYKFHYKSLTIKNTRSFWGKCSADNSVTLSLHLMHLPDNLIDYVILHELCHTVHKNHQKEFWDLLNTILNGKAKQFAKEMKSHSTRII